MHKSFDEEYFRSWLERCQSDLSEALSMAYDPVCPDSICSRLWTALNYVERAQLLWEHTSWEDRKKDGDNSNEPAHPQD